MGLLNKDGTVTCPDCDTTHGFLPPEPPAGQERYELVCTNCTGADDAKDSDTSFTEQGDDYAHRHHLIDPAEVDAYYQAQGKPTPAEAAQARDAQAAAASGAQAQGDGAQQAQVAGGAGAPPSQ